MFIYLVYNNVSYDTIYRQQELIDNFVESRPLASGLIFICIYTLSVVLSLPWTVFLSFLAGILFDVFFGASLVVVSGTLGSVMFFWIAQKFTHNLIHGKRNLLAKLKHGFQEDAFVYILMLRLVPVFPYIAVNLSSAFFDVPFRSFFLATLIGLVPTSLLYVLMGVELRDAFETPQFSMKSMFDVNFVSTIFILLIISAVPLLYKKVQRRKQSGF